MRRATDDNWECSKPVNRIKFPVNITLASSDIDAAGEWMEGGSPLEGVARFCCLIPAFSAFLWRWTPSSPPVINGADHRSKHSGQGKHRASWCVTSAPRCSQQCVPLTSFLRSQAVLNSKYVATPAYLQRCLIMKASLVYHP